MGLRDYTLSDVVARNARLYGARTAFVCDGARVTHRDYAERVERTAGALAAVGLSAGDRVALVADNAQIVVDLFGAAARLGLIFVPVNTRLSADEIAATIADADPQVLLLEPKHEAAVADRAELAGIRHRLLIGAGASDRSFESRIGNGSGAPAFDAATDTPLAMIYTAAVAGRPRGAVLSHGNLLAAASQVGLNWHLGPDDVNLGLLPLFHVAGLLLAVAAQEAGGSTLVMPRFEAPAAVDLIRSGGPTFFASFPPILGQILDAAGDGSALASLRVVTGLEGADTIKRLEEMCPNTRFWAAYGQAELSGLVTMAPFRDRPGSAGRPNPGQTIAIVDDMDQPLPAGQAGDIVARGPTVFQGYWRREDDNAATFRNGWHHTGDMGRLDEDGYLFYTARSPAKDLIKSGGENVYPAEVEAVLRQHPGVAEAVVIGVPDATWGEAVKAVCVGSQGASPSPDDVIAFVGERIARYKRPRHVVFVEALPRTATGSFDRLQIKAQHGA